MSSLNQKKKESALLRNYCLISGILACIVMLIFYFFHDNTLLFGDATVLRMDLYHQYGPLYAELYDRITGGKSLVYSWTSGLGNSFIGNMLNYLASPFAVVMLFTIVMKWNDYMSALLYLPQRTDLFPLQMALRKILYETSKEITSASDVNATSVYARSVEYAAIVVSTLPILCVYPFVQKYFVTGMTVGAVKA